MCVCVSVFHAVVSAAFITMLLQGSAVGVWISLKWTGYRNWSPVESDLTVSSSELHVGCILGYTISSKDCLQKVIDNSGGLKLEQAVSITLLDGIFLIKFMIKRIMLNCVNCVMLLWSCYEKCLVNRIT